MAIICYDYPSIARQIVRAQFQELRRQAKERGEVELVERYQEYIEALDQEGADHGS